MERSRPRDLTAAATPPAATVHELTMRARSRLLLAPSVALYLGSLFLPATTFSLPFSNRTESIAGWQAVLISLSALGELDTSGSFGILLAQLVAFASGLSNVVFLAAVVLLAGRKRVSRAWPAVLWTAVLVNSYWLFAEASRLQAGYFAWLGAFVCLALSSDSSGTSLAAPGYKHEVGCILHPKRR
jgi:hypothetical protein